MSTTRNDAALSRAKWRSSGLSDKHAKRLRFEGLTAAETARLVGVFATSLRIPYFDPRGRPTEFFRVRFLEHFGVAALTTKAQRYAQPRGSLNEVYLAPLLTSSWEKVLADSTLPLIITEGELKAAKAASLGFATMGLGGVDCWRSKRHELPLLPTLSATRWKDRSVSIIFDSDAATNPEVTRAQEQLAHALSRLGAKVRIGTLPAGRGGAKQGLDDFLQTSGVDGLKRVLEDAIAPSAVAELWAMNEAVVFVHDPSMVVVRATGQRLSTEQFAAANFANRKHTEYLGGKAKEVKTARRWLEWEQRLEVAALAYKPGQPEFAGKDFNLWRGLAVAPARGEVGPWTSLLDFLFRDEQGRALDAERAWFERWCAYPLQHLGAKLYTAVALFGYAHGTGKSLVAELLAGIYGANASVIGNAELSSTFNNWAENKQLVVGEEITGSDQRAHADRLKTLITQKTMRINTKYVPSFVIDDCVNYLFTSNNGDAFFLDDQDRRFFVHEVVGRPQASAFYKRVARWRDEGGLSHLLEHFLRLDLGDFDPQAPAMLTRAKEAMIFDGKNDAAQWVCVLKTNPLDTLSGVFGAQVAKQCDLFTTNQLMSACPLSSSARVSESYFGKLLKRSGFRQVNNAQPLRTAHGVARLYAVRNAEKWLRATPATCAEHWDQFFPKVDATPERKF